MKEFKELFGKLADMADELDINFVAAYMDGSSGTGSMAHNGESDVFRGVAAIINSDDVELNEIERVADALNGYILERKQVDSH